MKKSTIAKNKCNYPKAGVVRSPLDLEYGVKIAVIKRIPSECDDETIDCCLKELMLSLRESANRFILVNRLRIHKFGITISSNFQRGYTNEDLIHNRYSLVLSNMIKIGKKSNNKTIFNKKFNKLIKNMSFTTF